MGRVVAVVMVLSIGLTVSTALAQEEDPIAIQARALFDDGRELAEQGQWAEAAARFRRAHDLRPSLSIRYNLAVALEQLGRLVEAVELLRTIGVEAEASDPARDPASQLLREIEHDVAWLTLRVLGDDIGVRASLDGGALGSASLGVPIALDPGAHEILATRGRYRVRERVMLVEGATRDLILRFPGPSDSTPRREGRSGVSWPLLLGGAGLGAVGLGLDLSLAATHNGRIDGLDFVPVTFYVGAVILVILSVI
jgi:hypothetical protein